MAKLSNTSESSFAWSSVNPLLKPLKCFVRLLENVLYDGRQFLIGIHVSRLVECQMKMMNVQGDQAPARRQKKLKILENSSTMTAAKQSMSSQTPFALVMEFARRS
jgi:hypothetical protein